MLRRRLWGYPELFEEFHVKLWPVLSTERQGVEDGKEAKEHALRASLSVQATGTPSPLSGNGDQNEDATELGLPRITSDCDGAVNTSCESTGAAQPIIRPKCQKEAGNQLSPSDDLLPSTENSGSTEALKSASEKLSIQ